MGRTARIVSVICLALGAFFLACLFLLDYDENCWVGDCAAVHHSLAAVYFFDYSYLVPIINALPIPITLTLFIPCLTLIVLVLWSVVVLRSGGGLYGAIFDSLQVGLLIAVLFETGLYLVNPAWWQVHATNLNLYPFTMVTNQLVFTSAVALFAAMTVYRVFSKNLIPFLKTETKKKI